MTATQRGVSAQVPALTWDEIEIALGKSLGELADSIAHLVANGFIKSGIQLPVLFARMRGAEETHFLKAKRP